MKYTFFVIQFVLFSVCLSFLAACGPAASQDLPDVVIKRLKLEDGTSVLEGWRTEPGARSTVGKIYIPETPAFADAKILYESSSFPDPKKATEEILKLNGFQKAKFRSSASANKNFVQTIDGHHDAEIEVFFYEGRLNGKPAKAIAYTWMGQVLCGEEAFCAVAHVFMAPSDQFEALGGGATLAVLWLQQDVPSSAPSMKKYGAMPPEQATKRLAQYADLWMVGYLRTHVEMMQMMGQYAAFNQQLMNSMQSYNNALSQCGGWVCSITQGGDGNWTATPD